MLKDPKETLLNVANYLEAGCPNDAPRIGHIIFDMGIPGNVMFNGATACIGGMAYIWENRDATITEAGNAVGSLEITDSLACLFYPGKENGLPDGVQYSHITAHEASKAIRRYIYGESRSTIWDHVAEKAK